MKFLRRKKYLINKNFQARFAFFFLFEAIAVLLVTLAFLYHLHTKYSAQITRLEYNSRVYALLINSFVGTDLAEQETAYSAQKSILQEIILFALLLFAMVLIPSVIASHRIAGPLFKLNKTMKDISKGVYTQKLAFRKRDSFKEIEESFNEMVSNLHYRKNIDLQDIDNLIQKIIFLIKKNTADNSASSVKLDVHAIREILLKMKKRKMYNE